MLICFTSLSMAEEISLLPSTSNQSHIGDHKGRMWKPAVTTSRILQWEPCGSEVQWALTLTEAQAPSGPPHLGYSPLALPQCSPAGATPR